MIEPAASLAPASVDADELNVIVAYLQPNPDVVDATWIVSTED